MYTIGHQHVCHNCKLKDATTISIYKSSHQNVTRKCACSWSFSYIHHKQTEILIQFFKDALKSDPRKRRACLILNFKSMFNGKKVFKFVNWDFCLNSNVCCVLLLFKISFRLCMCNPPFLHVWRKEILIKPGSIESKTNKDTCYGNGDLRY